MRPTGGASRWCSRRKAQKLLERLSATHLEELRRVGHALQDMLKMLGKRGPGG
jgi:hypothetical protein